MPPGLLRLASAGSIESQPGGCPHTFVDGHQGDYFCRVIEDCVAGSSPDAHEAALRAMEYLQTGARRSLDEVLAAMDSYGRMKAA